MSKWTVAASPPAALTGNARLARTSADQKDDRLQRKSERGDAFAIMLTPDYCVPPRHELRRASRRMLQPARRKAAQLQKYSPRSSKLRRNCGQRGAMGVESTLEDQDTTPREPDRAPQAELIERLFREHNEALVRFMLARLRSRQAALEVAQEAYVRLLSLDQPGAVSYLRSFLFKT